MLNMTDVVQLWNSTKRGTASVLAFTQHQSAESSQNPEKTDDKPVTHRHDTLAARRVFNRCAVAPVDLQRPTTIPRRISKRAIFLHNKLEESRQLNAVIDHHMRAEQGGSDPIPSPFELEQLFYKGGSHPQERHNQSFAHRKKSG